MKASPPTAKATVFDTSVFNSLWVIANFAVVYAHVFFFSTIVLDEPKSIFKLRVAEEPIMFLLTFPFYVLLNYVVDVLLFLSGYLFANSICRKQPSQDYTVTNALSIIRRRFIRLVPVYGIAWAVTVAKGSSASTKLTVLYEMFYMLNCHPDFGKPRSRALELCSCRGRWLQTCRHTSPGYCFSSCPRAKGESYNFSS